MLRTVKRFCCGAALLMLGAQAGFGFALLGPFEDYHVRVLTLQVPGDIGGPHNIGEEFRRNNPVLYYSFDQNYWDYFGSNGVFAVDQAFSIMNGLTNVSSYSSDLSEFPLEALRSNYRAQALQLFDIKSTTLSLLAEQMGLAEPDRYTWLLHDRLVGPGGCPANVSYLVIKRNFDPVTSALNQLQPSSYVNGTLYSYVIQEFCSGTPDLSDAVEIPVDPLAGTFTAVAAGGFSSGDFYTGLTRDDVGGIRYLLKTNNMNIESAGPGTLTFVTNTTTSQLLFTSNLTVLVEQSLVNDAATLQGLFPGLVVADTTSTFKTVVTTNLFIFFTNVPYAPAGTLASVGVVETYSTNVQTIFSHTFANVVTNTYSTNGFVGVLQTNITQSACGPFSPVGTICTNVSITSVFIQGMVTGDYYILPTNLCAVSIIATQLTSVLAVTNLALTVTNVAGATNTAGEEFSLSVVNYSTNRVFVVRPVQCPQDSVALRQGIERVGFVRRDFDSLLNRFFYPITNTYVLNAITNNTIRPQIVQRVVTAPDILITAQDLATDPGDAIIGPGGVARGIQFSTNSVNAGLAGPGTIQPNTSFIFNKVGPIYFNFTPSFLDELTQIQLLIWGSFDGSTNDPVVYPNGTSIENLENQVLIQVSPASLSSAIWGAPYGVQFSASGSVQPPYQWALSPGSAGLPPGLTLSGSGLLSGTPTTVGTYDFSIRMTDAAARFVDRNYSLTINP